MDPHVRAWRVRERARLKHARQDLHRQIDASLPRPLRAILTRCSSACRARRWHLLADQGRVGPPRVGGSHERTQEMPAGPAGRRREQSPLEYRRWRPGDEMERGFWGHHGTEGNRARDTRRGHRAARRLRWVLSSRDTAGATSTARSLPCSRGRGRSASGQRQVACRATSRNRTTSPWT